MVSTTYQRKYRYAIRTFLVFRRKLFSEIHMLHTYYKKKYFKIFFLLISRLSYVHHCRLTSFGLLGVMVKNKKIKSVLRKLTMLLRKSDTAMHILLCLELPLNLLWWRNATRQHVIGGHITIISVSKRDRWSKIYQTVWKPLNFTEENFIQKMAVRNAPLPKTRKLARNQAAIVMSGISRWANWW